MLEPVRAFVKFILLGCNMQLFKREIEEHKLRQLACISQDRAQLDELDELVSVEQSYTFYSRIRLVFRCLFVLQIIRSFVFIHFIYYKFGPDQRNLFLSDRPYGTTIASLACMQTNCRMPSRRLLVGLPIYAICMPHLSHWNEPIHHNYRTGSLFYLIVAFFCSVLYEGISRVQFKYPTKHSMMTFMVAPRLTQASYLARIRDLLKDVAASYEQYLKTYHNPRARFSNYGDWAAFKPGQHYQMTYAQHEQSFYRPRLHHLGELRGRRETSYMSPTFEGLDGRWPSKVSGHKNSSSQRDERSVHLDCLPLIRSSWWRETAPKKLQAQLESFLVCTLILCTTLFVFYQQTVLIEKRRLVKEATQMMRDANCSLWFREHTPGKQGGRTIDLLELDLDWNWYNLNHSFFVVMLLPSIVSLVAISCVYLSSWELRVWICEFKFKLIILTPSIDRLLNDADLDQKHFQLGFCLETPRNPCNQHPDNSFSLSFAKLNEKFKREIWFHYFMIHQKPLLEHRARLENAALVDKIYLKELQKVAATREEREEIFADMLERLYVQFRLMQELRQEVEARSSLVTLVFIMMNYGGALLVIVHAKATGSFKLESWFTIYFCISLPISLILNSALLQARSDELRNLITPFLARTSWVQSARVQHSRGLWGRLLEAHDGRFKLTGILQAKFDYVDFLQIILGTATLLYAVDRI